MPHLAIPTDYRDASTAPQSSPIWCCSAGSTVTVLWDLWKLYMKVKKNGIHQDPSMTKQEPNGARALKNKFRMSVVN